MTIFILAYLGGVLTILSPCILPILPFVFARGDQPFLKSGLPLLIGMALSFAGIATLAAVGGNWAIQANQYGRIAALVLLTLFAVTLLSRSLADRLTRPLVALGNRLTQGDEKRGPVLSSFILGLATGLLWAPCAGPILGLVLTGAALEGASAGTTLLLFAYAAGAATSLAAALLISGRVFDMLKKSLGAGEWIRKGLGVAVLAGVAAIALGLDTGLLTRLSLASTNRFEQSLIDSIGEKKTGSVTARTKPLTEGPMPELSGATLWLNSPPLTKAGLRGKVVLIDFWTYSCINCLRALPYVRAWHEKYKDQGLVVIGVHAPEFAFEKDEGNVRRAVADLKVAYPVALDNNYAIWRAFRNRYWPAHYFIDAKGVIRAHHFGEGEYEKSERIIQSLLKEAGLTDVAEGTVAPDAQGSQLAAAWSAVKSHETYIGYMRARNFASGPIAKNATARYALPATLALNQWGLAGDWIVGAQAATLAKPNGKIAFRFEARDLHLVLGSGTKKPIPFRVTIDGKPPGDRAGMDVNAAGEGVVTSQRLYQLIRNKSLIKQYNFEIEFLDPGVEAYAFTFG